VNALRKPSVPKVRAWSMDVYTGIHSHFERHSSFSADSFATLLIRDVTVSILIIEEANGFHPH
jgi:hypothetical protein